MRKKQTKEEMITKEVIAEMKVKMKSRTVPEGLEIDQSWWPQKITNPFSKESVMLCPDAVAVYDMIKGSEALKQYDHMREGIEWFQKHEPEAYMVLLD
tara:strand:- start:202 stop:495 length:294 start_codon:yes stop_codon:yes gene_type:complete